MSGMSAALAARIREVGNDLPAVAALYADAQPAPDGDAVNLRVDLSYGPHERHRLDLFTPTSAAPAGGWPVLAFFHGGGFIRGSKAHRQNIGHFLARHGYAVVLANYRLAPESRWPCGPQDVGRVWQWLQDNGQAFSVDPTRIVLMGESAGAAHVAATALREAFHPPGWNIRGAVLLSGPYNARLEGKARAQFGIDTPDPRNEAYFGSDPAQWDSASTVDHVSSAPFALLIGFTQLDLVQMQVQAGELFARLVSQHGFNPQLLVLPDHNHFSQGFSIGTPDTSLSAPLLTFLEAATALT
ncbi:alpha/beta hydrolase [Pseudomonas silvicola]|nr:alpha/beta hydrolase [Pseudomonas silvicola]